MCPSTFETCITAPLSYSSITAKEIELEKASLTDMKCWNLLKSASDHFYHIQWSLPSQLIWKKFLLLTCQILGLLVNTLATEEKYPVLNRDNLTIPIQMQLSQKQKTFSQFFAAFLKSTLNFKHFESKDDPHRFCIFEVTDSENVVR